jgi:hypothetical protein
MNKIRSGGAIALLSSAALLVVVSVLSAKDNPGTQSAAISNCNTKVTQCVDFCQGSKDSHTRSKCEDNCLTTWNRCMDAAGAPKANRVPPINRRPRGSDNAAPNTGNVKDAGAKPTPRAGAGDNVPQPKMRRGDTKPTPSPTPSR